MKLTTPTSKPNKRVTEFSTSTSNQQTFNDTIVAERIAKCRGEGSLKYPVILRAAYIAGFNQSMSGSTAAPIPSEFAGGNEKTVAFCRGASDATLCLPICSSNRLFRKSLKNVQ